MKKLIILFVSVFLLTGCSSNGSHEIQLNEVVFTFSGFKSTPEDNKIGSSLFEIVPGSYTIKWEKYAEVPQCVNYDVFLTLRLRLKKSVNVKPELWDDELGMVVYCPAREWKLLDQDGNVIEGFAFWAGSYTLGERMKPGEASIKKDVMLDIYRFIQSEPGTEYELPLHAIGQINSYAKTNFINDVIKKARGIQCGVGLDDDDFIKHFGSVK